MSLTEEQKLALDELMRAMRPAAPAPQARASESDMLQAWLGFSRDDLRGKVLSLLADKDRFEKSFIDWIEANPLDANLESLGIASWAFYQAEKDANPRIKNYVDAFYYISTCASVGYADIFAVTPAGKAIAALVMIIGPSLTGRALDRPKAK